MFGLERSIKKYLKTTSRNKARLWGGKKHFTKLKRILPYSTSRKKRKKEKKREGNGKKIHMEKDGESLPSFPWNVN